MSPATASDSLVWTAKASDAAVSRATPADALATSPIVKAVTLSKNPIGYWRLDNLSGAVAKDLSGNGRDGTAHGNQPHVVAGLLAGDPAAQATSFSYTAIDGQQQNVVLPSIPANLNTGGMTFSAWVKLFVDVRSFITTGSYERAATRLTPSYSPGLNLFHILGLFPNIGLTVSDAGGGTFVAQGWLGGNANAGYSGLWGQISHLVARYQGFGSSSRDVYINGVKVLTDTTGSAGDSTGPMRIGEDERWNGYDTVPIGTIQDPAIFNYALSPADISDLYLAGKNALGAKTVISEAKI